MNPIRSLPAPRGRQRGVAALAVALILLFGITLVAFFTNRSLIFEQRTSANQYRSTRAMELAEAGLEWAVARLNEDAYMSASLYCTSEGNVKFADRYLPFNPGKTDFTVNTAGFPGCSVGATGATTCGCPSSGYATLGSSTDPRFRITFSSNGTFQVRITSYGCTNQGSNCDDVTSSPDATAVVSAVYQMRPTIANAPAAGLVAGSATSVTTGTMNVYNHDPKSGGITIDSGSSVTLGSAINVYTLPGTPPVSSVLENDDALNDLTTADSTGDAFFKSFFGQTLSEYQNDSRTWTITTGSCGSNQRCSTCSGDTSCGSAVVVAYTDKGARQFWSNSEVTWNNSNTTSNLLGSSTDPIIFASTQNINLKGSITAYGMFYCATATADADWASTGNTATVYGAFISRGDFTRSSGTLNLIYDSSMFGEGGVRGTMVRVPGSWRDKSSDYTTSN